MAAPQARAMLSRIGIPLLLLALATVFSLVALGQPFFTVTEEDQRDGTVTVSKFLGLQVTKETYSAGRLVEVEVLPYDSPLFGEVSMGPVLQLAFVASLVSTILLVLGTGFLALSRWRAGLERRGLFLVLGAALAAIASTAYLAMALAGPIGLDIDPAAGFFPGGISDANGSSAWGPGLGWYVSAFVAILALSALVFHIKEHGIARWRAVRA